MSRLRALNPSEGRKKEKGKTYTKRRKKEKSQASARNGDLMAKPFAQVLDGVQELLLKHVKEGGLSE